MSTFISRSAFIKVLLGAGAAAVAGKFYIDSKADLDRIPCRMLGPSKNLGHMLRDRKCLTKFDEPSLKCKLLIVGGGIAGLSAAWYLQKNGFSDFKLLELEKEVGGNSASAKNHISSFPWGAHYVPLANEESSFVRELFEELGVITSYNAAGLAEYNELYLCHDPQERLYKDGHFQEGLVPKRGLQERDQKEIERFFHMVDTLRQQKGKDGKFAFAIPLDLSSADGEFRELDKISMSDWLKNNGFDSAPLLWYINYCCRDDYGSTCDMVSAWAGLHYFAGRRGRAVNAENNSVVTWPQGNGFLVKKLRDKVKKHIITGAMVSNVEGGATGVILNYIDSQNKAKTTAESEYVILSTPRFVAKCLLPKSEPGSAGFQPAFKIHRMNRHAYSPVYCPWLVANLSLRKLPSARGEDIAWDNVSYYSDSLGYVVATHQDITTRQGPTVITYYLPMSGKDAPGERSKLVGTSNKEWVKRITDDLERMHPGISADILAIDLWPWGHGMVRPSVGYIWGEERQSMKKNEGRIFFAHSDMSGISNFEEAQYQGVEAAKKILSELGAA